ncbi:MAG TPA: hypothetical protein VMH78_06885 [Thermoplasmata archaeon]|nr:hypothetical protein [Thermoplasmata archaeon]
MERTARTGLASIAAVALLAGIAAPALAVAPAGAPAVDIAAWAYGAQTWTNASLTWSNGTVAEHAFFGWQVVVTATNTSTSTQAWEVDRTVAGYSYVDYCAPSCVAPTSQGNLSIAGIEHDAGFANLTSNATVVENGTAVPAVGILNASFDDAANLTESVRYTGSTGPFAGTSSAYLDVAGAAHGAVALSPALGLAPTNLTSGATWDSTSGFSASGGWALAYTAGRTTLSGTTPATNGSANGSVAASGTVSVHGADVGTITLADNETVPVVVLAWTGPFDAVDGVVLVPHAFDLFGGAPHPWDTEALGGETVATSTLDMRVDAGHHLRLAAAASTFGSSDAAFPSDPTAQAVGASPAASSGASPMVLQAQPEPVPVAQGNAACLAGSCAGASAGAYAGLAGLGLALVGLVVAAVIVVGLLVTRGRRGRAGPGAASAAPPTGAAGSPELRTGAR